MTVLDVAKWKRNEKLSEENILNEIQTGDFQIESTTAITDYINSGAYSNLTYMLPGGVVPSLYSDIFQAAFFLFAAFIYSNTSTEAHC